MAGQQNRITMEPEPEPLRGDRLRQAFERHSKIKAKQTAAAIKQQERQPPKVHYPPAQTTGVGRHNITPPVASPVPRNPLPYDKTYGTFFGKSQKVVSDRLKAQVRKEKKLKDSGSPLPQKQARVSDEDVEVKVKRKARSPARNEPASKKPRYERTDYSFLHTDEDPTDELPPLEQHQEESLMRTSTSAKQRSFQGKGEKTAINRGTNVQSSKAPIEVVKRAHSSSKETQANAKKDLLAALASKRKEGSSKTHAKGKAPIQVVKRTHSPLKESTPTQAKDKNKNKKLTPTMKSQDVLKQIKSNHPKGRRGMILESDDDNLDNPLGIRNTIHKIMRFDAEKHAGRDDKSDASDMEADFATIEREERRSERIGREEDERELALIVKEEERERARKKKRKLLHKY